jgi:hypothetical protein
MESPEEFFLLLYTFSPYFSPNLKICLRLFCLQYSFPERIIQESAEACKQRFLSPVFKTEAPAAKLKRDFAIIPVLSCTVSFSFLFRFR